MSTQGMKIKIGKTLKAKGIKRSQWIPSRQVRGWGNSTEGYDYCVHLGGFDAPAGAVGIEYNTGSWVGRDRAAEARDHGLDRIHRALTAAGFTVKTGERGSEKILIVTKGA